MESEKTTQRGIVATAFVIVFIIVILAAANTYGSYLYRLDEAERYAIAERRGGTPVCVAPDGIYVKFTSLDAPVGEEG